MGFKKKATNEVEEKNNVILDKVKKKKDEKNKESKKTVKGKFYLGYIPRVVICLFSFVILIALSFLFLSKTFNKEEQKIVKYQEIGTLDYKVYLKENEFYDATYLDKNMYYIASIIKNINLDFNYQFVIEEPSDMSFTYDIMGKLVISSTQNNNVLYQKEYILKTGVGQGTSNSTIYNFKDSLSIDYDHYNDLANRFKSTYGVDANSELQVYVRINKKVKNEISNININDGKQMSLTIPLTQKTLEIKLNDTGINNTQSIVNESEKKSGNILFGVLAGIIFIVAVATLLKLLELLMVMQPKASKYDKHIKKLLTEYDRLIVETPSEPRLDDKEIIKIKKFEELLDARDNLKRPIMYHNITTHQKCYFYIEKDNTVYLLIVKAADLEENKK